MTFGQAFKVWVWDSTLVTPWVVVQRPYGCALVILDQGIAFNVTMADLLPDNSTRHAAGDIPSVTRVTRV